MSFAIKTEIFEGPLDVLLDLIEKRKLLINDIALAQVADEYMEYVRRLEEFPTRDVAGFVLLASTLVLIKSKSLLPQLDLTPEEQTDIADLELRLKMYKRIKELSEYVTGRFGKNVLYPRNESKHQHVVFAPDKRVSKSFLAQAMQSVISNLPKKEFIKKAIVEKIMSLEDMMQSLTQRIQSTFALSFREFAQQQQKIVGGTSERELKVNMVISFLAMLELVKQGIVAVKQHATFGDIHIEQSTVGVPTYK